MPRARTDLPPVLYEDEHLLALDKPAGLLVVPDRWDRARPHLMGLVHARLSPDLFNAHRLDHDTSGVLLCARRGEALRRLAALFAGRGVRKTYLALATGLPPAPEGVIGVALAPDRRRPGAVRAAEPGAVGARPAQTAWSLLESWRGRWCLLRAEPRTGRTHQVRAHLAHLGCPIIGDPLYGEGRGLYLSDFKRGYRRGEGPERPLIGRTALHAAALELPHPITGAPLTIAAPLPADLTLAQRQLRRFGG